jgi:RNA polymerase sigma factor (TIGR02999 family)
MATSSSGDPTCPVDVTGLLNAWTQGDLEARERLFPLIYADLRRIAGARLKRERSAHTLQPTELVHEVFLKLAHSRMSWKDRGHFYAVAAEAMRRVLIDHARSKRRRKRGAGSDPLPLDETVAVPIRLDHQVIELIEALGELRVMDSRQGEVVDLRFFAGLSVEETALALDLSPATIKREWSVARTWLHHRMTKGHGRASML